MVREKFETGDKSVTDSCVLEIYAPCNAQYVEFRN